MIIESTYLKPYQVIEKTKTCFYYSFYNPKTRNKVSHREDGPSSIFSNGDETWCKNGLRHRLDGPAIDWPSHKVFKWYINGVEYTEQQYNEKIKNDY